MLMSHSLNWKCVHFLENLSCYVILYLYWDVQVVIECSRTFIVTVFCIKGAHTQTKIDKLYAKVIDATIGLATVGM